MLVIKFSKSALSDWDGLDNAIRTKFKKKLVRLAALDSPRSRLRGFGGMLFKVKIAKPQFRLIYRIDEHQGQLIVIAAGPRDSVYTHLNK